MKNSEDIDTSSSLYSRPELGKEEDFNLKFQVVIFQMELNYLILLISASDLKGYRI